MALPSWGGGMGRVYLCAAGTLSPSAAELGVLCHAIFARANAGKSDASPTVRWHSTEPLSGDHTAFLYPRDFA
jgi:hypothetical protein